MDGDFVVTRADGSQVTVSITGAIMAVRLADGSTVVDLAVGGI